MLGRAQRAGKIEVECLNYRDFAKSLDGRVDDRPYGGGPGMILQPQILAKTLRSIKSQTGSHRIYLSASGDRLTAKRARELSRCAHLILICGHYEGIDQRAVDLFVDEEISIGDFILTSGCPAALTLLDAIARFLPGVLGHPQSNQLESFESGLLEAPQYTRPQIFEEKRVPAILIGGDHQKIDAWKRERSIEKTRVKRPDLLKSVDLCALNAKWSVGDLKKCQIWFSKIWPFDFELLENRTAIVKMGAHCFELQERGDEMMQKDNTSLKLMIDLPLDLSKRVWKCAEKTPCEIDKAPLRHQSADKRPLLTGHVTAIDPEGITWQWCCSFSNW